MLRIALTFLFTGLIFSSAAFGQAYFQSSNVRSFATGEMVRGGATLLRDEDSIQLQAALMDLHKKSVYTIWFIIFDAAACTNPSFGGQCGEADFGTEALLGLAHATGFVTGTDGTANADAELEVGALPVGKCCEGGLTDSMANEVHIVIQSHGVTNAGDFAEELIYPIGEVDQFFAVFAPAPAP